MMRILTNGILFKCSILIFCSFYWTEDAVASSQGECVDCWARKLGKDLWELGNTITKSGEIKSKYAFENTQVEKKDPRKLLAEIIENIARMMDRKMDAVKCIVKTAEEEAEKFEYNQTDADSFSYYNSKYSYVDGEDEDDEEEEDEEEDEEIKQEFRKLRNSYKNMTVIYDTHFYNLSVNTNHSSVHVPSNIYDRHMEPSNALQWSEALDSVFKTNYNSDPSLFWQYFASSSGIMRHYPAMKWMKHYKKDEFDARIRTWFIEASTCTKDAIILLDNSGSMAGMRKHIATLTVQKILDTFSNNDYINVLNYSTHVNYTVPCFNNTLVQATKENVLVFKEALEHLKPNDKSNLGIALNHSLALLKEVREKRGCQIDTKECNQCIMLVTDGVSESHVELFEQFNSIYNGSDRQVPVRIFTYLVGKEVSHVEEIRDMACMNRGYFSHIQALEQVRSSVLNYIMVIARPLVLQGIEHPASWTHAYADETAETGEDEYNPNKEPYRLLASVAVPAFDTKVNKNNETRVADLLGVAGTDVPIDDIGKLTFPYKIGVNGYAFVVSNNGYVLMHPDLRPIFEGQLKENSNSVDLTEVEQLLDDYEPREINPLLLELREKLVNGINGSMHNISLKYHYDDNRRIAKENYNYYFAPLVDTPFSVGIALPSTYGLYNIDVGDEIQKNKHTGYKIESYFNGSNWKVHPKWAYCRYHYLEGHEFDNPEEELLHFLKQMYNLNFTWSRQYEANVKTEDAVLELEFEDLGEVECGRALLHHNDYYCDKQLVQRLIFDAKNTMEFFKEPWKFKEERESLLFDRYNASLRFVATMSGLTRWEYIYGEEENNTIKEFGDWHARAINENWYKSAILQHKYDPDSFVYSVPFEAGMEDVVVTGSYAIFPKDAGVEAPGSVVGFQFSHARLREYFFNITTTTAENCRECVPCGNELDCYIIDSSGYIIVSQEKNHTGRFFGEVEGAVLESMLERNIFEKVTIYDFQGVCKDERPKASDAFSILSPFSYILWAANNIIGKVFWVFIQLNIHQLWDPDLVLSDSLESEEAEKPEEMESFPRACDTERDLFELQQSLFLHGNGWLEEVPKSCSRSFFIKRIIHSNLMLVAVNATQQTCHRTYSASTREITYSDKYPVHCQKLNLNTLPRRRLSGCFNEDPLENEIKACGKTTTLRINNYLIILYCFVHSLLRL